MLHRASLSTKTRTQFIDISSELQKTIDGSGVRSGICCVYSPHTTAGITVNEHADPSVVQDIAAHLDAVAPRSGRYQHREGNADAHIKASLMGASEVIPVEDGRLMLGTWQGVFFCEFDGPRSRKVIIRVLADQP
jgi:secondary thiamine-phosphate synthase enzyme